MRMQEEVRLASKIQMELLPQESPRLPGYEIAGRTIPAQTVGGDYFDFIPVDDHRIAICLGDVSGKGLPASLLMANLQATLRGQTLLNVSPKECLIRSNRLLFQSTSPEKFATLFYGILDVQQHVIRYSNAGHDHPFVLRRDHGPLRLSEGGIPLAMMNDFPYEEGQVTLSPGDVVVLYSDGITEAMNAAEEQFSEARVAAVLLKHQLEPPDVLIEQLTREVKEHADKTPQSDDMTVVVVKRV
jgi:sigma-B regulation protein RsbU (phosphoserine phosphatase)